MSEDKSDSASVHETASASDTFKAGVHSPLSRVAEDHPTFTLIGRVMAEWAQLEHILDMLIWHLADGDNVALACVTSQLMGPAPRFLAIIALATYRGLPVEIIDSITNLQNRSNNLNNERNRFAHDAWFIEGETHTVSRFKKMPRGDLVFGLQPQDERAAHDLIGKIVKRQEELWGLWPRIRGVWPPSPDRP